jgi:hypothetical protein
MERNDLRFVQLMEALIRQPPHHLHSKALTMIISPTSVKVTDHPNTSDTHRPGNNYSMVPSTVKSPRPPAGCLP